MQFLSQEFLARQAAKASRAGALAAWLLLGLILLQLPIWLWLMPSVNGSLEAAQQEAARLDGQDKALDGRARALEDVRAQLAEVRRLEPVLTARLPAAAVLATIEKTIPAELVCGKIRLSADSYAPVAGGLRTPQTYNLRIEGWLSKGDRTEVLKWANTMIGRMPTGSGIVTVDHAQGAPDSFLLILRIVGGDLTRMGLTRIPIETASAH